MADDPEADLWTGVSWVLEELTKNLDAIREVALDESERLFAFEHQEEAREFKQAQAKRQRRAARHTVKGGAR